MYSIVWKTVCFFLYSQWSCPTPGCRVNTTTIASVLVPPSQTLLSKVWKLAVMCVCVGGFCLCATQPDFVIKGMETGCDVCVCWGVLSLRHPARLCYQRYGNWLWCVCVLGGSVFAPPSQTLLSKVWKLAVMCVCVGGFCLCATQPDFVIKGMETGCDVCVCWGVLSLRHPARLCYQRYGNWLWCVCVCWGVLSLRHPARLCYQRYGNWLWCVCVGGFCLCATQPDFVIKGMETGCDVCVCERGGPPQPDLVIRGSWLWRVCVWEGGVHPNQTLLSEEAGCDMLVCVWGGGGGGFHPCAIQPDFDIKGMEAGCDVWGGGIHPYASSQTLLSAIQCSKWNYIWLNAGFRLQSLCLPPVNTVPCGSQIEGLRECDFASVVVNGAENSVRIPLWWPWSTF